MNPSARKQHWTLLFIMVFALLAAMPIALSFAQQGGNIDLRRNVIAGGGNTSTGGGNKEVSGTSGQGTAGAQSSGGTIVVKSGFWHGAVAPPAPPPEAGPGRFAFTASTYTVNEDCTEAIVSINRVNGVSVAATVDYNVTNGTGYTPCNVTNGMGAQNCDFSYTTGTLSFGVGETSKTLGVLISRDAYVEGNEQINFSLSNPTNGATLGGPSAATLTVLDNAAVPTNSQPIDDATTFVGQHYHDFLARSADPGGAAFWQAQITQCGADQNCLRAKRLDVSNSFFFELEYQQTGSYVFRLYRAAYGDNQPAPNPDQANVNEAKKVPGYAAFLPDRARVIGGASLAQSQLDLANAFVGRPEFLARYPANLSGAQFIAAVLQNIQAADGIDLSGETAGLTILFTSGGRGAVLYRLADDNTQNPISNQSFINAEYNRAFVTTQYFGYLRRDADIGGLLFWLGQINSAPLRDVDKQHGLVCSFVTSIEYQLRFSASVTHSNAECQ
jgi:hypothetical protein